MKFTKFLPALVALTLITTTAPAGLMTYLFEGSGSGTLDGVAFPVSDFTITAIVDTEDRYPVFSYIWSIPHRSTSISIDNLGDFDFTSPTRTFINVITDSVGFSRSGEVKTDLFSGVNAQFGSWDMVTPIGPVLAPADLFQWSFLPSLETTGGTLIFNSDYSTTLIFTALPEPASMMLLGLGGLLLRERRKR